MHYVLNKRSEAFWTDNRLPETIPESLQDLMRLWKYRAPADHDFTSNNEVFPAASYQYILYGMGFKSDYSHFPYTLSDKDFAERQFSKNKAMIDEAVKSLPKNRELLNKVKEFGFNRI